MAQPNLDQSAIARGVVTLEKIVALVEANDYRGLCLACGEEADNVEPDARKRKCEVCGKNKVYGAEELLLMFVA